MGPCTHVQNSKSDSTITLDDVSAYLDKLERACNEAGLTSVRVRDATAIVVPASWVRYAGLTCMDELAPFDIVDWERYKAIWEVFNGNAEEEAHVHDAEAYWGAQECKAEEEGSTWFQSESGGDSA